MNSLEQFNHYYENLEAPEFSPSLLDFFQKIVEPRLTNENLKVLDLGAGSKSIFEETNLLKSNITAVDFSSAAISKAQALSSDITYKQQDLTADKAFPVNSYDLIFDSHCLHCLTDKEERKAAFENIFSALKDDGILCAEMMVRPGKKEVVMPFKFIPDAFFLEEEIKSHGFKIIYFMIEKSFSFQNAHGECDLLRVIARK